MPASDDSIHLSARVPADLLQALDQVAALLERPRSWIVVRALRQYLAQEGAEALSDAASLAALDRGDGHDLGAVLDEAEAIIAAPQSNRAPGDPDGSRARHPRGGPGS